MTDRKHTKGEGGRRTVPVTSAAQAAAADAGEDVAAETAAEEAAASGGQGLAGEADEQLAALAAQRDEYLDHLRRLQAEFDNYRKRVQRDGEQVRLRAAETVVESLLPVMDNMARALAAADRHEEGQIIEGLQLVAGQLRGTLAGHGLDEIEVVTGTVFDPTYHEAVLTQPSDEYEEGVVLQVLERGYLLHGRLLRPAKVIVAS